MQTRMPNHAQIKWFSLWTDQMFLFHKAQDLGLQRVSASAGSVVSHLDKTPDLKRRLKSRETGSFIWEGLWTWNLLVIYICVIWYKYEETESFMEAVWGLEHTRSPEQSLYIYHRVWHPDGHCYWSVFVFFLREEEGTTTFFIIHRTIRREAKLARITVSKTVGFDRMSYFFLLFISPFSRRPLSPIRDVRQRTTNTARFCHFPCQIVSRPVNALDTCAKG